MSAEAVEVQTQAQSSQAAPSINDRLRSVLSAPSEASDAGTPSPSSDATKVQTRPTSEASNDADEVGAEASAVPTDEANASEGDPEAESEDVKSDDAQTEDRQFSTLTELLEAAGLDSDKGFDLELPVKIDGKEGTAKLRDLVKSYQLDGYINQRLEAVNTDKKAVEADRQKVQQERATILTNLTATAQVAEKFIQGKYAHVDWQRLANEDPATYQTLSAEFNAQNAQYQVIAQQLGEERQQLLAQQQAQYDAHLTEQRKLVEAAFPEWSNETTRAKDKQAIAAALDELGAPKGTFEGLTDAWQVKAVKKIVAYDALMKSKPTVLNKVKAAPKLLKPGSPQSKDVSALMSHQKDVARLRQTGRIADAAKLLRGRI